MATPFALPLFRGFDASGAPLAGGKLWTYRNGTTTPEETYSNSEGTVANPNPVVLNARGEAIVYLDPEQLYTFELRDSADVLVWALDVVSGVYSSNELGGEGGAFLIGDAVVRVDNIVALRALPPPLRKTVAQLEGYHSPGDRGGGSFLWVSTSTKEDDKGMVIMPDAAPSTGRWERSIHDTIDIRMFGVTCPRF